MSLLLEQKIPNRLVPTDMEQYGAINIVCHPRTLVRASYAISSDDGRLCVSGWKEFMDKEKHLQMGDKMLFCFTWEMQGFTCLLPMCLKLIWSS